MGIRTRGSRWMPMRCPCPRALLLLVLVLVLLLLLLLLYVHVEVLRVRHLPEGVLEQHLERVLLPRDGGGERRPSYDAARRRGHEIAHAARVRAGCNGLAAQRDADHELAARVRLEAHRVSSGSMVSHRRAHLLAAATDGDEETIAASRLLLAITSVRLDYKRCQRVRGRNLKVANDDALCCRGDCGSCGEVVVAALLEDRGDRYRRRCSKSRHVFEVRSFPIEALCFSLSKGVFAFSHALGEPNQLFSACTHRLPGTYPRDYVWRRARQGVDLD